MRLPKLKEINAKRLIDMAMQDSAVCPLVALLSHAVLSLLQGVADLPAELFGSRPVDHLHRWRDQIERHDEHLR